jgi:WW domain-binding protein 4
VNPPQAEALAGEEEDEKPDVSAGEKRPAETIVVDEEDTRSFKIRKRTLGTGLGEIYDPGAIPIKVKKREEPVKQEEALASKPEDTAPAAPLKLAPFQLKSSSASAPNDSTSNTTANQEQGEASSESSVPSSGTKWAKVSWAPAAESEPIRFAQPEPSGKTEEAAQELVGGEEEEETKPETKLAPPAPVFKKRKAPASSARGRRQI